MPGPLFITDPGQMTSPGVKMIDVATPTVIEGVPNGKIAIAAQFEWGPINVVYEPLSSTDFLRTYAPQGFARQSTGYRALMRRKRLSLAVYRVAHSDAVKAVSTVAGTGGSWHGTAKYEGAAGNGIVITQAAASDGVSGHKKFTASVTDPVTGTYSELIVDNLAPPTGTAVTIDVSSSALLSSFTVDTAMTAFPADGPTTLGSTTPGSNGSAVTAADYNAGFAALDLIDNVAEMGNDDCGDSIRAAVNADLLAVVTAAAGRYIGNIFGNAGNNWAAVKTDIASYRSKWVNYFGNYVNVLDDGGVSQKVPAWTFAASARINLAPRASDAWQTSTVTDYYSGISSVDTSQFNPADSTVASDAMALGIRLQIKLPDGRFAQAHDRNTSLTVGDRYTVTSRIRRFLGLSMQIGFSDFTNAPMVPEEINDLTKAARNFMNGQKSAGNVSDFTVDAVTPNTPTTEAQGEFFIAISATTPAPMERIGIQLKAGPTVILNS